MQRIHNARRKLLKGRCALGDIGIDERIYIKIDITEIICEGIKCFPVAEDRVQCRTFVNVVGNTWIILELSILCLAGCLLTTVKVAISGNSGDQRAAGYFSFPGMVGRGFDSRWCHWNFSVT